LHYQLPSDTTSHSLIDLLVVIASIAILAPSPIKYFLREAQPDAGQSMSGTVIEPR